MARWITPKTNWEIKPLNEFGRYNGDWFNVFDYSRIKGNLEYIAERMSAVFNIVELIPMSQPTVSDIETVERLNAIERNIDILRELLLASVSIPATKTWYGNGAGPTIYDLNRIESSCFALNDAFEKQIASSIVWKIPFHMNGRRF